MDDFAKEFGEKYLGQQSGALTASVLVDAVARPAESVARRAPGSVQQPLHSPLIGLAVDMNLT